ncbi:hypothetical protein K501DRAFT_322491 [Backusella circina FSU 941]|nr:hypothetical protein K501DRAFT_322491 [Backusella circina FSU 941]
MYDATQKDFDLIRKDRAGVVQVQGGTLEALVLELLTTKDDAFIDVFLTTWSTFTTGSHLMMTMSPYAEKPEKKDRLLDLIMVWCKHFSLDVMGDVATRMIAILDKVLTDERARTVKDLVLKTVTENSEFLKSLPSPDHHEQQQVENIAAYDITEGKRRDSVNLSNLIITGLTPDVFLIVDPTSFAEQIYIFHISQYHQYQQIILNSLSYLPKPQSPVQMLNSLLFTTASPHFLTKIIRSHILIDSQQQEQKAGLLIRSQLLEHWIHVGLRLMELGDMTGWCAVAMGVCSVGIVRLRETWKAVDRTLVKIVQEQWAKILTEHGLFNQNKWSDEWSSDVIFKFAQILDVDDLKLRQNTDTPSLPFFGTLRQSVDCLKRRINRSFGPSIINFDECRLIHDTIKSSLGHWSDTCAGKPVLEGAPVGFPVVAPLQSFFEHSVTDLTSVPHDLKYLQECSLACEPKIFGQGYDRRGSDVSPPSSSSLVFPELLYNYRLLDLICIMNDSSDTGANTSSGGSSSQGSSTFVKTHPRKRGKNSSIRSLRSFLDDNQSNKSSLTKNNLRSLQHLPITSSSSYSSLLNGSCPTTLDPSSPPKGSNRKAFRRRTYSFPSGNPSIPPGKNDIESDHTKTWIGSFISNRYHSTYSTKTLIDTHRRNKSYSGGSGEIVLSVQQGELIFKASALLTKDKSEDKDKPEDNESIEERQFTLLVHVKGGYLEYLVELLVFGIKRYMDALKDQWRMISLTEDLQQTVPENITLDDEEYISTFFVTYRTFCSSTHLLDMLQKRFVNAKEDSALSSKKKSSLILLESYFQPPNGSSSPVQEDILSSYDWKKIASIQLRVLNILLYWSEEHFYDFIDEVEIHRYIHVFIHKAKEALNDWITPLQSLALDESNKQWKNILDALAISEVVKDRMKDLQDQFLVKSLSPCYDMKAIEFDPEGSRGAEELYQQLTSGNTKFHTTLQLATNRLIPLTISKKPRDIDAGNVVDRYPAEYLLEQVDKSVRQLFVSITMQDWIQTFDIFEAQSGDLYAWLPARKPSRTSKIAASLSSLIDTPSTHLPGYHILPDEVIVSDIFTAIEGAKRSVVSPSAFSDDDLLLAFPGAIQYLYCMHFIIRSWVIQDISSTAIDLKTRVLRIEKFLQIVMASRASGETVVLCPELKDDESSKKRIPGFVEYAIASALVSPEVRIFTKAWNDVAMQHDHANLDTLENLLHQIQKTQLRTPSKKEIKEESKPNLIVPSLGWIFERILELCVGVPDTFENRDNVINFDKRRCVFHFLQLIMNAQMDVYEQKAEEKSIGMSFLISPNPESTNWKELREFTARETKKSAGNATSGSLVMRGPSYKSHVSRTSIFGKLVTEQMDKMKRDFKERDRVDKEWLSLQHKLQKKQLEHARQFEKNEKTHSSVTKHQQHVTHHSGSVMPRINSFLRGLRPQSMVVSPIQHIFPSIHTDSNFATLKASTVINLIHSTTSVASTYTKREFVFRIVTEEGGQYLFQGMNREDMYDWMQQINNAAREGAAKRQSVLAAESMNDEPSAQNLIINDVSRTQPPTRSSVYGVTLDYLMRDGKIPAVVDKCTSEIERRGLEEVGIYRVAGTGSVVSELKTEFNKNVDKVDLSDPAWADINVIADALKQFLRELPEPLLTYTYYDEFINASASEDHDERIYLIKKVLKKLPYNNYMLLKRIIEHFVIVTDFEAINHMYATNLAIVFGPTLLQPAPGPASFATTMSNLGHHQNIVKYLILNYHYLFDIESDEVDPVKEDDLK